MKHVLVSAAVLIASTSLGYAQSPTGTAQESPRASFYLDGGSMVLAERSASLDVAAVFAEGGLRIAGSLWAHGMVVVGEPVVVDFLSDNPRPYSGTYAALRAGLQYRACDRATGRTCLVTGIDLGGRHYDEHASASTTLEGAQVTPRVGADIGIGRRMWLRPAVDGSIDVGRDHAKGFDAKSVSLAVGFQY